MTPEEQSGATEVNSLWIGRRLSPLERLTLASFAELGCSFRLWSYGGVEGLPSGVEAGDAREVVPSPEGWNSPQWDSPAGRCWVGFSEMFRLLLLYRRGGWWADMDVTLLKPLPASPSGLVMARHCVTGAMPNVLHAAKGDRRLLKAARRIGAEALSPGYGDWHLPTRIVLEELGPAPTLDFGGDDADFLTDMRSDAAATVPEDLQGIHWCSSVWTEEERAAPAEGSVYARLLRRHAIS